MAETPALAGASSVIGALTLPPLQVPAPDIPLKRIDEETLAIIGSGTPHHRLIELLKERKLDDGRTYYEHISTVVFTFFGRVLADNELLRAFAIVKATQRAQSEGRKCVRAELVAIGQVHDNIITALFEIFDAEGIEKVHLKKCDTKTLYPDCKAKLVDIFRAVIHELIANGDFDKSELIQQLFRVECAYGLEGLVAWFLRRTGADNLKIEGDKMVAQGLIDYLRAAGADIANCSARIKKLLADPSKTVYLVLKAAYAGAYSASFDPPSTRCVFVRVGFFSVPITDFDVATATSKDGRTAYLAEKRHFALDVDDSLTFELDPTLVRLPASIFKDMSDDKLGKWNCAKLDLSKIPLKCFRSSLFIAALHSYCAAVYGDPHAYLYLKTRKAFINKCVKPVYDALRHFLGGTVGVFAAHAAYIASTDAGQNIIHSSCRHVAGRLDVHEVRGHRVAHWGMVSSPSQDFSYICTREPELSIVTDFLHNLMKDTILGRAEVRRVLAEVDRRVKEARQPRGSRALSDAAANSPAKRKKS